MLFIRRLLREMGLESRIYVDHRDLRLGDEVEEAERLEDNPAHLLLVHHSMGHDLQDWLCRLRMPRLLVWHNITPPELLAGDPAREYARIGFGFLDRFRPHALGAIANSAFSARELTSRRWPEPDVIPLLVDLDRYRANEEGPLRTIEEAAASQRILFVGRLMRHKNQLALVEVADRLRSAGASDAVVDIVGSAPEGDRYLEELRDHIASLGLSGRVVLHGHVSDERLRALYRGAVIYCSLSEHEGFGMPLVEAMASNVAVVSYRSSSIETTMGGAGILLSSADPDEASEAILRLLREPAQRRAIVRGQRHRLGDLEPGALAERLAAVLTRHGVDVRQRPRRPAPPTWQIEGPCETDYSLAIVNRELARGLDRIAPAEVAALPIEGPGGYVADAEALRRMPDVAAMVARARHRPAARTVLRNLYPPRVHDMDGDWNLLQLAWEETLVPAAWVAAFNRWLDGIVVPSRFTARALRDSGIAVPIAIAPHGISHALQPPRRVPDGPQPGLRTFLHVSSCFPRKGADLLLRAFREAFTGVDPVELLIKTFPNPHNDVPKMVRAMAMAEGPREPKVRVIDRELSAAEMADLYSRSHALVAPSRGEGFGLPVAEAMAHGLPVVITDDGAMAEFVPDEAGIKLPWRWQPSTSHVAQPGSLWQEPDFDALVKALRDLASAPKAQLAEMGAAGRARVQRDLSWDTAARTVAEFADRISSEELPRRPRVGWVSTWKIRCGIATYSEPLVRELRVAGADVTVLAKAGAGGPEEAGVVRCWGAEVSSSDMDGVVQEAERRKLDAVVVQFQFGLYHRPALAKAIAELLDRGITVIMTLHSVRDVVREGRTVASLGELDAVLGRVDRLLVHSVSDVNLLVEERGLENVTLFPHGCEPRRAVDAEELRVRIGIGRRPAVGTFGFLLPNKGVVETLEAWPSVLSRHPRAVLLLMTSLFDAPESAETLERCRQTIARLGIGDSVLHITEFLQQEEAAVLLESCDLTVFPYRHSAEGASGAVRLALGTHRPVLCTREAIFDDLRGAVQFLDGGDPASIAEGISRGLLDPDWRQRSVERQDRWVNGTSWTRLACRLDGMLQGLVADARRSRNRPAEVVPTPSRVGAARATEEDADVGRTG